jgi:hypothetical protein
MENTKETSELIADFMEAEYYPKVKHAYSAAMIGYHVSWDALMPVVEKIESLDCVREVSMFRTCCRITPDLFHVFVIGEIESTKLQATYQAVVKFIAWYNINKQPK